MRVVQHGGWNKNRAPTRIFRVVWVAHRLVMENLFRWRGIDECVRRQINWDRSGDSVTEALAHLG